MRKLNVTDWIFVLVAVVVVTGGGFMLFSAKSTPVHHQQAAAIVPASHSDGLSEVEVAIGSNGC